MTKAEMSKERSCCGFVKNKLFNSMWERLKWARIEIIMILWEEHLSNCDGSWIDRKGFESMIVLKPPFWKHGHSVQ
jgi:hypothetical protein